MPRTWTHDQPVRPTWIYGERHLILKWRLAMAVGVAALFGLIVMMSPNHAHHQAVNVHTIAPEVCEHNGTVKSAWRDQSEIHVTCSSGIVRLVAR